MSTKISAKSAPPRCAKCATLSPEKFETPKNSSTTPYIIQKIRAGIGIGIKSINNLTCGNIQPKANKIPKSAQEAPIVTGACRITLFI